MSRPIHKISITNGNNLGKNQAEISGDGYSGDICLIVSAKIKDQPVISIPCVFYDQTNLGKCIFDGKIIDLVLVNKFDTSTLSDGECCYSVSTSFSDTNKSNINGYYILSEISTSSMKFSNTDGDSLLVTIPPISNTTTSFVQLCDFTENDNVVDVFFRSPLSVVKPPEPPLKIPNNINTLNFDSVIPSSMNSGRVRFENFFYDNIGAPSLPVFSNIGLNSPTENAVTKNIGDVVMLLDIVSSGTVSKNTNNDFIVELGVSDPQVWFPILFVGYSDTYGGSISDRFKVKYTLTFGKSKLSSGNSSVVHNSSDIKDILPPDNTFQTLKVSDMSISDGKTWGFAIDMDSYSNAFGVGSYLRPTFGTYDGFGISSAIEDDNNNSGHIYLSTHAWNSKIVLIDPDDPSAGFYSAVDFSSSAMKGNFIIEIDVLDTKLSTTYNMSININSI